MRSAVTVLAVAQIMTGASNGSSEAVWQIQMLNGIKAANAKDFKSAEEALLKAVQLAEHFTTGDVRLGTTWNTLGLVYKEEKKYSDAQKAFEKALAIMEKDFGSYSLDAANINFNVASSLLAQGQAENAVPYIQKSQVAYGRILGVDSLKSATTFCMLGEAYRSQNRLFQAEGAFKECANKREAAGGIANPDFADALMSLGLVYQEEKRYDLADSQLKLAAKVRELTLGVTSPELADALDARAAVLKLLGKTADAGKNEAMAAAIRHSIKKTN